MDDLETLIDHLLSQMTLTEKVALLSGQDAWNTVPIERLGIPSITMTDGPHGVRASRPEAGRRAGPATAFPTGSALAATWDPALTERIGQVLASETRALGCHILLGPCVNIIRHPLAGRTFESFSEDPFLAGRIGTAYVKGLQSQGIGASLKHFACNNQEFERMRGDSLVDERTLREIYLAQFEMIVKEANPWTVMCSYNRLNGTYASQHRRLLTDILKEEWGYDGVVVSDWGAVHATVEPIQAGLDLEMPGPARYFGDLLVAAVVNWQVDEAAIDDAARRMLRLFLRLCPPDSPPAGPAEVNTPTHQALARQAAEASTTLLKNEGSLLPWDLASMKSLAVIGPAAAQLPLGGGGSSFVRPPYRMDALTALKEHLGDRVSIRYEQGCDNYVTLPVAAGPVLAPARGEGSGLTGEYFTNPSLHGEPHMVRTDPLVDFWWYTEGPTKTHIYSVRWTGKLVAPEDGRHTLQISHSARVRLIIDGELLLDADAPEQVVYHRPALQSVPLDLERGRAYDLRLEFFKPTPETFASMRLMFAPTPLPGQDTRMQRAVEAARSCDAALVLVGNPEEYETEGADRPNLALPGRQDELVQAVLAANPNTVVVVYAGAPVAMPWFDQAPAVLFSYYPGMEGGRALARILIGEVNPSGKLPFTMPRRLEDTPAYLHYPGSRQVNYGEGIFVGYRYYDRRGISPLLSFGHGLSYTQFEYSDLKIPARVQPGSRVPISLTVTNTGARAGEEVVQLYVGDPEASLPRPPKELKAFQKVFLQPGESREVDFELDERSLAFFDPGQGSWVAEPGEFEILVGASSRDIRLQASFILTNL